MLKWLRMKQQERKNTIEKKLNQEILHLEELLKKSNILYELKSKQYNTSMVESELRIIRFQNLLAEEKETNGKLLDARLRQIGELKKINENLSKQIEDLKQNNELLKNTLGYF